jgi:Flp pilus assembly protein TadD
LKETPENLAAGTNLGTLLAKSGDLEAAATLWQQTFRQNADIPELGQNLAKAQCMLGQKEAAESTLKIVLTYSPGLSQARHSLAEMEDGSQPCLKRPASENK